MPSASKKRKSAGESSGTSIEEQRKRARVWRDAQLAAKEGSETDTSRDIVKSSKRASIAGVPSSRTVSPAIAKKAASSRKSLAPEMLSKRVTRDRTTSSSSPSPKKTRHSIVPEEQGVRTKKRTEVASNDGSLQRSSKKLNSSTTKSVGAERKPQKVFSENEIPASLRPSRPIPPPKRATRRASLESGMSSLSSPSTGLRKGRASVGGVGASIGTKKNKRESTPEYISPSEESSVEEDTRHVVTEPRRPRPKSFSAARRSSVGSGYDEGLYAYPADFRHQFKERKPALSSPESAVSMSPLINGMPTPGSVNNRRSSGRRLSASVKKNLLPASSSESESGDDAAIVSGNSLTYSEQKARAKQWRDSSFGGRRSGSSPAKSSRKSSDRELKVQKGEPEDDPDAIEMAEAPETIKPSAISAWARKRNEVWLKEVLYFSGGVIAMVLFMAVRAGILADTTPILMAPFDQTEFVISLTEQYGGVAEYLSEGVGQTMIGFRRTVVLLLIVSAFCPVCYGLYSLVVWFWKDSKRKADLIEIMADEGRDLLFNKYNGGPYPVEFLMEFLMDKYKREGSSQVTKLLSPGETLNRTAFRKLWPLVEKEVTQDSRIEVIKRTYEGKTRICWRVIGGERTVNSTHLVGDFPVDDFGHEDAHSSSSYTPAKVEGSGFSFL